MTVEHKSSVKFAVRVLLPVLIEDILKINIIFCKVIFIEMF